MEELNELKLNIANWYDFKNCGSILCYGNFDKCITDYLNTIFKKVVVSTNIEEKFNDKFDYIFILEMLNSKESDKELISKINKLESLLNENGSILLVAKNYMGVKNLISKNYEGFSKERIKFIIENSNIKNSKFYYGFPDVNDINLIVSDEYKTSIEDVRRNMNFSEEKSSDTTRENKMLYDILKNNNAKGFKNFANIFFVEINSNNNFYDVKAVYFNNIRRNEHRLITRVFSDYAQKNAWSFQSVNHIEQIGKNIEILKECNIDVLDSFEEKTIISKVLSDTEKLEDKVIELFKKNDDKYVEVINKFKNDILLKLQPGDRDNTIFKHFGMEVDYSVLSKLTFIKHGLWDLTFQNVFIKDDKYYVFDQEWYKENVPVEFLLFRAVKLLELLNEEEKKIILEKLDIYDYINVFERLEHKLQEELTNYSVVSLYINTIQSGACDFDKKYERLVKELEFQAKLVKSKELILNEYKESHNDYDEIKNKLNEEVKKNAELETIMEKKSVQTALRIQKDLKIMVPPYKLCKKAIRVGGKIIKIPARLVFNCFPKKVRRKVRNKIQFSRKLSKITRIPMITQYNTPMRLMSLENNSIREVYSQYTIDKTIGIHLHLYYEDLAQEFYNYLNNIPYKFDLYISINKNASKHKIKRIFSRILNLDHLEVVKSENCGRDFGPMFVLFAEKLKKYDYVMHIHSKKSLRTGNEQSEWRRYLLNNILGSKERIMKCFFLMENYNIGLVYPDTHHSVIYWAHTWLNESGLAREMCKKLNIEFPDEYLEFSAGSMFWAKKDAIAPLLDLNLTWDDFGQEKNQTGGTLEYVFERIPGIMTRKRGYDLAIFNEEQNTFLLNKGEKQLSSYYLRDKKSVINDLLNYDVISFDIFDTLITRKIYNPDDLFLIMEKRIQNAGISITDYKKIRKDAEFNVRVKKQFKDDCSIDEIYDEFKEITGFSDEQVKTIKNIEFDTELEFCISRRESLDVYNELLKHSKKIVLISDMYLTKDMLEKILNNCGYYNYFELLVSSEVGFRKDDGTMWTYFYNKYADCKTIHVGDNEESDLHKPVELGKSICHFMQGKKMYGISNYNMNKKFNLDESLVMGCILNKGLFNSPFAMYKYGEDAVVKDEFVYGYSILGPIIFEYLKWIINSVKDSDKKESLLFVSREGWYLRKIYEYIVAKLKDEKIKNIENHYFYISRRAITVAQAEKLEDLLEIMKKSFKGTLRELFYHRLGYKLDFLEDYIIELPKDYELVKNVIISNYENIMKQVRYEKENYLKYVEQTLGDYKSKNLNFLDLGYSGTAQYYLSLLLDQKIDGKYFAISGDIKPLSIGCNVESCYNENLYDLDKIINNPIYKGSILIEAFLTAPQGQLQYFRNEDEKIEPVFNFDNNLDKVESSEKIYKAIIEYIDDMFTIFRNDEILNVEIDKDIFLNLYSSFFRESKNINKHLKKMFDIDDYYCSNGVINGIEFWKKNGI